MSVIQNIGIEQAPLVANRLARQPELSSQQARAVSSVTSNSGQELVVRLSDEAVDVANIQETKNSLNDTAKSIRIADQSMQQMNAYIEKMKANLNAIIKQYPPFPPGSEERISYLRSFNAFRRQIDQLSLIPADESNIVSGNMDEGLSVSAEVSL